MIVERVFFGRGDGSKVARTTETINGKSCSSTTYWDTQAKVEVTSSDCLLMNSTVPFTRLPPSPATPIANCSTILTGNYVGSETIQGLRVHKFDDDTATSRSVNYYAPDLGCLLVRSLHYSKASDGSVRGTSFEEPVEIKQGSPDPDLFVTPASYREVWPSERRRAVYRCFSGSGDSAILKRASERDDKRYAEAWPNPLQ